jgi:putative SOS response-associated peptidase YedK
LETCTIITTDANAVAQQVHNRMPVILSVDDCVTWLNPALQTADELQHLLQSYPDDELTVSEADPYVNNARHEGPECLGSPGETR